MSADDRLIAQFERAVTGGQMNEAERLHRRMRRLGISTAQMDRSLDRLRASEKAKMDAAQKRSAGRHARGN